MLAGLLLGIVHDRRLMQEAQVDLAVLWVAGCGLQDRLPEGDLQAIARCLRRRA